MPHIDIDYADTLSGVLDLPALVAELHPLVVERVDSVGVGKTFCRPAAAFVEGRPRAAFVHVTVGLLAGRASGVRARLSEDVLALLGKHLSGVAEGATYSVEVRDLDPSYRLHPTH
ncbi:5-carboxymethyl-2-hydroxymuconate Delta-isomerase [Streptomyces formicae]|uniref:Putative isomerase n=1 Tax=Streptomyces formicae TaxID=1616117 RepID=A0A291Q864_9ACTN|nr:5-carboxymethyl-2-hydroxymuconate delta isomerase [Streptomyces formicae]ATL27899.1 putative isomerase [Streptomyces formicae]